ncbi:eukaryotic translation initiation factor SUI1 [Schizopora paradoxa]|uniref:Eukaryotic translation initiation factor SUI1 n=1 Tax=Schizopora paradoxa TaxID=27342 RepID=A0A0H2RNT2_9AGAM|nr:eukaryotic translation initiation factor SUI1 [Schizopora paradoxa]
MSADNTDLDPFKDDILDETESVGTQANDIHIRIQQRNGRKSLTTLQGIGKEYDLRKILKEFKREFACNGNIVEDDELGKVIQLQGDQRGKIYNFLVKNDVEPKTIKLHGF